MELYRSWNPEIQAIAREGGYHDLTMD